jgi:shikimate kinase
MKKAQHRNIFLIGPMGAGKSSVGKYLASRLDMDFYDTDEEIENRTGVDIGWIFDVEGEAGFRKRETEVITELAQLANIVLATGGGSVMTPENQTILRKNGVVIYLDISLEYQHDRTINESRRPVLRTHNREEILEQLYHERTPVYEALADYRILTDKCSVRAVVDDIILWIGKK